MVQSLMTRPREEQQVNQEEEPRPRRPRRAPLFVVRRTVRRFLDERGPATAASLAVLSLVTAVAGMLALLGALGASSSRVATGVVDVLEPAVPGSLRDGFADALRAASAMPGDWVVLAAGAAAAVVSAFGYVAVVRASTNRSWQVVEGRTTWRLLGRQFLLAVAWLVLGAAVAALLAVSGAVMTLLMPHVGLYLSESDATAWDYARWPLVAVVLVVAVTLLHRATPNVRFERKHLITGGSFVSILLSLGATAGLAAYLAWFPSWESTVGTVAAVGAVVLWLWTVQAALVLGAHLDAEVRRARELRAGLPAEEQLQVPVRDDRAAARSTRREERAVARMRELRVAAAGRGNPEDRPFGRR